MRRLFLLALSIGFLFSTDALAASASSHLVLNPQGGDEPVFTVSHDRGEIGTMRLEFHLPALVIDQIEAEGRQYQILSIPGGSERGADGAPGLPSITRLIALPAGASARLRVLAGDEKSFRGYRLFPVQPDGALDFVIDRAEYRRAGLRENPAAELGAEAVLRDLRIVPITFNPVSHDPVSGELRVASRIEVEIDFNEPSDGTEEPTVRGLIPESFDRLYRDTVLNYRTGDAQVGPGTYLVVCYDSEAVTLRLAPLLEWRRRQGYNVLVETFDGAATSGQIKTVVQAIYDSVDPPLEYICIVGDVTGTYHIPCFYESVSGYHGEGDHYYTTLAGDDFLADCHIGRLSFQSTSELEGIVDKIVAYETNPPVDDDAWFTRATICGDPFTASGVCTVYVSQWLRDELLAHGYSELDTIFDGNFLSEMVNGINEGCTIFSYRGIYGMSGFQAAHALYLSNGYRLPFALFPTCDTGSFSDDTTCRSEAFLRAANGGAIGAIGTATIGTHTRYNNCLFHGVWEGVINCEDHHSGFALTRGKLELYNNYIDYEPNKAETWAVWNNLMGDPATDLWTGRPVEMTVSHPVILPSGANSVPVRVEADGLPVEGALVALYREGELRVCAYSDHDGGANLPVSGLSQGEILVTVTRHNHLAHLGSLSIGAVSSFPALAGVSLDDDASGDSQGNGDGELNPGETIELSLALRNFGSSAAMGVEASLTCTDSHVTILDGDESYGDIAAGETVWCAEDYDLSVSPDTPDGHIVALDLLATDGMSQWTSLVQIPVHGADFGFLGFTWAGGATLDPGETGAFELDLRNDGSRVATGATAYLSCASPWITIIDDEAVLGDVDPGALVRAGFSITISGDCFQGHLASFELRTEYGQGSVDLLEFSLPVGMVSSDDPIGPDAYGYYAFDNSDTSYLFAPVYDWVEIDPSRGGQGASVGLTDFNWEQDDTRVLDLPFSFPYYGQSYDRISVCSNGWVAMGVTSLVHYRNWSIPSAGSPDPLIAVFWDNLEQSGDNKVYYWHDVENSRFIVEYSRLRNCYDTSPLDIQACQMILYDPLIYPTATGDGEIVLQYDTVENSDYLNAYATVGIQNLDGTDGLLYTFAGNYAPGAATLVSGRAIRFTPIGELHLGVLQGFVANASNGDTPVEGVILRILETSQSMLSAADGNYSGSLNEDIYSVRAEHPSFETVTESGVQVSEDEITTLDFFLTDILGPTIENVTHLPYSEDTVGPYIVDAWINDFSAIHELHFYYRVHGGSQQELTLNLIDAGAGQYRAEIPGHPLNTQIEYWLEAEDLPGNQSREPAAADSYHEFWILAGVLVIDDDMESDQGWSVDNGAATGFWTRAEPIGSYVGGEEVQPEYDASTDGTLCWVTGNNETGNQGVDDIDDGTNILISPLLDLSDAVNVELSYRRWYTNDTGSGPGEDYWIVEVEAGDDDWVELENTNESDRSWSLRTFKLDDYIELSDRVRVRFTAYDLGNGSVVEAAVDEFMLSGFSSPTHISTQDGVPPARLTLLQNAPNPFNPETGIRFGLPAARKVDLRIYDSAGRLVRGLVNNRRLEAGFHTVTWNGRDDAGVPVASGVYFYRLSTERETLSSKMILLK